MPSLAQKQADQLTRAMEDGDANAAAQVLLVAEDRGHVYTLAQMGANWREDLRPGFWSDVETLLRLETASDETEEQQTERWDAVFNGTSFDEAFVPGEEDAEEAYDEAICTHGGPEPDDQGE